MSTTGVSSPAEVARSSHSTHAFELIVLSVSNAKCQVGQIGSQSLCFLRAIESCPIASELDGTFKPTVQIEFARGDLTFCLCESVDVPVRSDPRNMQLLAYSHTECDRPDIPVSRELVAKLVRQHYGRLAAVLDHDPGEHLQDLEAMRSNAEGLGGLAGNTSTYIQRPQSKGDERSVISSGVCVLRCRYRRKLSDDSVDYSHKLNRFGVVVRRG
jgi:hypothetical protein